MKVVGVQGFLLGSDEKRKHVTKYFHSLNKINVTATPYVQPSHRLFRAHFVIAYNSL